MQALAEFFELEVENGGEIEGEDLGDDEAADDNEAQWAAALGGHASDADGDGDSAHDGGEGGHEDGAKTGQARFIDGFFCGVASKDGIVGEIDHDDAVFHDDAEEEDKANEGVEGEGFLEEEKGEKSS